VPALRTTADRMPALLVVLLLAGASWAAGAAKNDKGGNDQGNGQEKKVEAWFDDTSNHGYAVAKAGIERAAQAASQAGVPEKMLVERLEEGAAKNTEVATLERALQEEAARLIGLAGIFDQDMPHLEDEDRAEAIREGAIALRAGMDIATIEQVIRWSVGAGLELHRTMAALAALGPHHRALALGVYEDLALVGAMVRARERPSGYAAFASLLASAHERGMDTRVLVETSVAVLARRGTFLAVRQELDRKLE
jgi:predicted TIM-barrel fold metal-dependent hydrolase